MKNINIIANRALCLLILWVAFGVIISCQLPQDADPYQELRDKRLWTESDRAFILNELDRTTREIKTETATMDNEQWNFRESPDRWNIQEIIEHLEVQNELHFREIRAICKTPQELQYVEAVRENDAYFSTYATDPKTSKALWFLEPIGRFCSGEKAQEAFFRARGHLREYVQQTDTDLRKHFTYREYIEFKSIEDLKPGDVRDLHQLLLTGIAHTDRHLGQIRQVKEHINYPK